MNDRATPRRTLSRSPVLFAALLTSLAGLSNARADVVLPPPTDCPDGSEGATAHGGPYCQPSACTEVTGCEGDLVCQPLELCIAQMEHTSGYGTFVVDAVEGSCAGGESCSSGTCQTVDVCAPEVGPTDPDGAAPGDPGGTTDPDGNEPGDTTEPAGSDPGGTTDPAGSDPDSSDLDGRGDPKGCSASGGAPGLAWMLGVVLLAVISRRRARR